MYCQAHHLTLTRSNALLRSWARGEYCEGREAAQTKALLKVELTIIGNDEEDVARAEDLEDDGSGRRVRLRLRAADEVQARVHHVSGISPCPSRGNEHISSGRVQPTAFLDEGRPGPVWAGPPGDRDFHVSDLKNSNNVRTGGVLREHAERVRQELRGDITRIAAPLGADSSSTSDAHPTIRVEHMRDGTWGDQGVCELPVRTSGRQRSHNLSEGQHSSRDRFLTPAGERISSASFVGGATACAGGGGPVIGLATAAGNGDSDYSGERGCCENGVAQAHQQKEPLECRKYSGRAAVDGSSANVVPRTLGGVSPVMGAMENIGEDGGSIGNGSPSTGVAGGALLSSVCAAINTDAEPDPSNESQKSSSMTSPSSSLTGTTGYFFSFAYMRR